MKKVIIDLNNSVSIDEIHDVIAREMNFPDYYGRNLDALYDCLGDICEDTCVGIFYNDVNEELYEYCDKVVDTFMDAEEDNCHLAVFA